MRRWLFVFCWGRGLVGRRRTKLVGRRRPKHLAVAGRAVFSRLRRLSEPLEAGHQLVGVSAVGPHHGLGQSQTAQTLKLPWATWNAIVFFSFFATLLLFWILPWFPLGLGLLVVAYVAPLATYVVQRNKQMRSPYDKVFSPKHTQRWMAHKLSKIGIKVEGADDELRERGPDLQVTAMGAASDRDNSVNLLTARQSRGLRACPRTARRRHVAACHARDARFFGREREREAPDRRRVARRASDGASRRRPDSGSLQGRGRVQDQRSALAAKRQVRHSDRQRQIHLQGDHRRNPRRGTRRCKSTPSSSSSRRAKSWACAQDGRAAGGAAAAAGPDRLRIDARRRTDDDFGRRAFDDRSLRAQLRGRVRCG